MTHTHTHTAMPSAHKCALLYDGVLRGPDEPQQQRILPPLPVCTAARHMRVMVLLMCLLLLVIVIIVLMVVVVVVAVVVAGKVVGRAGCLAAAAAAPRLHRVVVLHLPVQQRPLCIASRLMAVVPARRACGCGVVSGSERIVVRAPPPTTMVRRVRHMAKPLHTLVHVDVVTFTAACVRRRRGGSGGGG